MRFLSPEFYSNKIARGWRHVLCRLFGIDAWHVSLIHQRPYALAVVDRLNGRDRSNERSVLEIGCGLGEIVRNVRWSRRVGLDADPRVVQAARFISMMRRDGGIEFDVAIFPDVEVTGRYDAILMINWIHHIDEQVLRGAISRFMTDHLTADGEIILDTVSDPAYKFNHDIARLTAGLPLKPVSLGEFSRGRQVFALQRGIGPS